MGWFYSSIILCVFFFLLIPISLAGAEGNEVLKEKLKPKTDFVFTIKGNLISVNAKDASSEEVIEEISN